MLLLLIVIGVEVANLIQSVDDTHGLLLLLEPSHSSQPRLSEVTTNHSTSDKSFEALQVGKIGEPLVELLVKPSVDPEPFILSLERTNICQKLAEIVTSTTNDLVRERLLVR